MQKPKIVFRADGSARIGLGHLFRSLALAQMLESRYRITFIVKEAPTAFLEQVLAQGYTYQCITEESEWVDTLPAKIVVLDGYHFDTALQRDIRRRGAKLVYIDDLRDGCFEADLVINHAPGVTPSDYTAMPYTKFALGPEYALLRPSFLEAASINRTINAIDTLLICFGGSDIKNITLAVLKRALLKKQFKKIIVITGPAYQHESELLPVINEGVEYYNSVGEEAMGRLMLEADIAIVPSSSVLLEVIACGTIPIICFTADNQRFFHRQLVENHGFMSIGDCKDYLNEKLLDEALAKMNTKIRDAIKPLRSSVAQSKHKHLLAFNQLENE